MCKAFIITIIWKINVKPPKTTGWLTLPLGKCHLPLLLLIYYSHVDVTSFFFTLGCISPHNLFYLHYFYETPLFKTISPGVVRSPWTNDCKLMKQGPGVILSSHGGHFRSTRA